MSTRCSVSVTVPAFSITTYFGCENCTLDCGGMSSSWIVTVATPGLPTTMPAPGTSVTVKVSSPSPPSVSLMIGMVIVLGATSPIAQESVPVRGESVPSNPKSFPDSAVPFTVAHVAMAVVVEAPRRSTRIATDPPASLTE